MTRPRWVFFGLLISLLCGSVVAHTPRLESQTVRVVSFDRPLQVTIGQTHGLFARYGVQVQLISAPDSEELRSILAEGKADVAYAAVDNAVAMAENDSIDVVIVSGGNSSANELIAQPGIESVAGLRGLTVIVDASDTAFALQLKKILLLHGLRSGSDYHIQQVGSTSVRFAAMKAHQEYSASMLGPPTSILAKHAGFVSLGSARALLGPYQEFGMFVRRDWARDHADLLERYLAGYVEAQRWLIASTNKGEVLELFRKQADLSPDLAEEDYALNIASAGGYQKDARFDRAGFKNVLSLRAEIEGTWHGKPPAPDKYYDPSYFENALKRLRSKIAGSAFR